MVTARGRGVAAVETRQLLKTRENWMKAVGERWPKGKEKVQNENCVLAAKRIFSDPPLCSLNRCLPLSRWRAPSKINAYPLISRRREHVRRAIRINLIDRKFQTWVNHLLPHARKLPMMHREYFCFRGGVIRDNFAEELVLPIVLIA